MTPFRRFPGQHQVSNSSKIPSIIYYDFSGKVQAIGAEAIQDETAPEDGERIKVEWLVSISPAFLSVTDF